MEKATVLRSTKLHILEGRTTHQTKFFLQTTPPHPVPHESCLVSSPGSSRHALQRSIFSTPVAASASPASSPLPQTPSPAPESPPKSPSKSPSKPRSPKKSSEEKEEAKRVKAEEKAEEKAEKWRRAQIAKIQKVSLSLILSCLYSP